MKIIIDIKAIADAARREYETDMTKNGADNDELSLAPMTEIADYVMGAVCEYVENLACGLEQELQDVVETEIVNGR